MVTIDRGDDNSVERLYRAEPFVEIVGLLTPDSFDSAAAALAMGGRALLSRLSMNIGIPEHPDEIRLTPVGEQRTNTFKLHDLALSFDVGDKYDPPEEDSSSD